MIGTAHASDPYDSGVGAKLLSGFNLIEGCVFAMVRLTEDTHGSSVGKGPYVVIAGSEASD